MASASTVPVKSIQLKDKVIAITGANRGIGLGIADCCLSNGAAKVYSIDIGDIGDEFNSLSSKFPGQLFALQADVTKEESIQAAVDKIVKEAGAIHGMVANAGRTKHKAALEFTTEEIDQLWGVNVGRRIQLSGMNVLTQFSCTAPSTQQE
jgi:NAD(P)-dependent dehydrogenase (short-subunit alcohol dehydrogenase family)